MALYKFELVEDVRKVLTKAWSIRFALLSGALGGVEAFLPMFSDAFPRGVFAGLSVLSSMATVISRVVAQKELRDPNAAAD